MKILDAIALVNRRLKYKPNFKIEAVLGGNPWSRDNLFIAVTHHVPDASGSGEVIPITISREFAQDDIEAMEEDVFVNVVVDHVIRLLESHEHDEWLKLDGKPVRDPHPRLA